MKNRWVWLIGGVVLGAVVAPKIRTWIPSLPSVGR